MPKDYRLTDRESELNKVLAVQSSSLSNTPSLAKVDRNLTDNIDISERLLSRLGMTTEAICQDARLHSERPKIILRSWEEICAEADILHPDKVAFSDILCSDGIEASEAYVRNLRREADVLHRFDAVDYAICGMGALLAASVDILSIGIPEKTREGIVAGPLSNYIRNALEKALPPAKVAELERKFRVPYDAVNNAYRGIDIDGHGSWFHRLQSLGHDPLLSFVFGVLDILQGKLTAVDKNGNFVRVSIGESAEGTSVFEAIATVFGHLKSDITTDMGLPVPLMTLFGFFQFGSIGDDKVTIAEVVRGMYAEGYDFIHFCSMAFSPMLTEVFVRLSYCLKRVHEGHDLSESIPFSTNRETHPKLGTMLFLAHMFASSINAGKIAFTGNPMAINWAQWMAFAKYSLQQLSWVLSQKERLRDEYVESTLASDWSRLDSVLSETWQNMTRDAIVVGGTDLPTTRAKDEDTL